MKYSPIRGCEFVVQCHLVGRQRESIHLELGSTKQREPCTYFCQTRKIHQGQIQYIGAVNSERYRQLANTFVLPCHPESLLFDFLPNFIKVGKFLVDMKKLSPFRIGCTRRRFFWFSGVNKLKHKGSPGNNPLTAWKKVSSNYPKNIKDIRYWELDKRKQHTFPRH